MNKLLIDFDLRRRISKIVKSKDNGRVIICCGFNSSFLGDERTLREFLVGAEIERWLKNRGYEVKLVLVIDSFDPVNLKQLEIALDKDSSLLKKFKKYCGSPPHLIPDPFSCHKNYAIHFQSKLLERLKSLDISPEVLDTYLAYKKGVYDPAKELLFTKYKKVTSFLKEEFLNYSPQKIFWPLCKNCKKMDKTIFIGFKNKKVKYICKRCKKTKEEDWKEVDGKISWKIDHAFIWNLIQTNIEPFSKSYLDSKTGSYFVAKAISREFFDGKFPEPIMHGQILIDRRLQNKLLDVLPQKLIRYIFLLKRRSDVKISKDKLVNLANKVKVINNLSFLKYVKEILPAIVLQKPRKSWSRMVKKGLKFSEIILGKNLTPELPTPEVLTALKLENLETIKSILEFVAKQKDNKTNFEKFGINLDTFLTKRAIKKAIVFPQIRTMLRYKTGLPIVKVLYHLPSNFILECIYLLERH